MYKIQVFISKEELGQFLINKENKIDRIVQIFEDYSNIILVYVIKK